MAQTQNYGTGKRKTSVARVFLRPGKGGATVNGRPLEEYFTTVDQRKLVIEPLQATETDGNFDLYITVKGGGLSGQAGAVRHGIAKALVDFNPDLRGVLKEQGLLTRDARKKERKKPGQRGARARFQFSKR
ncbi:MAG TPA: 30S ribosomal protein S9 [Acidobacteriota bacterium]|jgi:small subunit ribosomal protein S9|nr:30S ribosomal protein S9 [Acidobacteriota bacterium]MDP6687184.1 30S ribosomal protein S9 [Acidobacteriota bacterium]MEC7900290.1 30S ribosomal protein S9 [Acidobacteriota bacterium]MEE3273436.1 30S ribosomal protein S9 [Acidobacteriota bacterium]HJO29611.1 30S ribosomal protein S9 [Acidobacteriota bacterium]